MPENNGRDPIKNTNCFKNILNNSQQNLRYKLAGYQYVGKMQVCLQNKGETAIDQCLNKTKRPDSPACRLHPQAMFRMGPRCVAQLLSPTLGKQRSGRNSDRTQPDVLMGICIIYGDRTASTVSKFKQPLTKVPGTRYSPSSF